jgi:LmbE family N-acetylglucosaminyl deacetylase
MGGEMRVLLDGACARVEDFKTYELVERMDALVRELQPAAVFTHGPGDFHKDHLTLFNVCVSALRVKLIDCFSYYPTSCRPVQVDFNPTVFVDITQEMETKIKAVRAHPSQFSARGLEIDFLRDIARVYGRMAGCRYAEGLELVRMAMAFKPAPRAAALLDGAASGSASPAESSGPGSTS